MFPFISAIVIKKKLIDAILLLTISGKVHGSRLDYN